VRTACDFVSCAFVFLLACAAASHLSCLCAFATRQVGPPPSSCKALRPAQVVCGGPCHAIRGGPPHGTCVGPAAMITAAPVFESQASSKMATEHSLPPTLFLLLLRLLLLLHFFVCRYGTTAVSRLRCPKLPTPHSAVVSAAPWDADHYVSVSLPISDEQRYPNRENRTKKNPPFTPCERQQWKHRAQV
jgi:hypothetical protein